MPTRNDACSFIETIVAELIPCRSMVYVGDRHDTHQWWHTTLHTALACPDIDIIDISEKNLQGSRDRHSKLVRRFIAGDVRTTELVGYDLVLWDEGPEHVPREDALLTLSRLIMDNSHVMISCPWGYQPQGSGPDDGEFHHWGPMPDDFESIGMKVRLFGTMFDGTGGGHGNLIAWS